MISKKGNDQYTNYKFIKSPRTPWTKEGYN